MSGSLAQALRGAILVARAGTLAVHRRLLPDSPRIGWTPYLWLFWLISFALKWFFVPLEPVEFSLALLTLPPFLWLYFDAHWHSGRRVFLNIAGILLIALLWTPFNGGAITFFVYAAAFIGRASRPPSAFAWLAGIVLLVAGEWLVLDLSNFVLLFGCAVTTVIGAAIIHFEELDRQDAALKLSQAEVRRLAAVAERERIGRDLHDLLGHTLSLITIKAELAAKLAGRRDSRAEQEIREVERISRGALKEIREAVTGFRRADLDAELASARLACHAADIQLTVERPPLDMPPEQEAVLAMCLREAITNVVRHAGASRCQASLVRDAGWACLTVQDDGRGGAIREGAGLAGMRERVRQAGGEMTIETAHGVTLTVRLPAGPERPTSRVPASGEAAA
ncbi:MAG: sensor histidine kinase [Acidobacteria bacterium]|nr:sensor histidine kinase [Acidobacteriota bacterium]MYJ03418.1 sensor histidine kinase [Acidobacteriota bacterium]